MTSPLDIPVIDICASNIDAPRLLLGAAAEYGFVFVENNDEVIPPASICQLFDLSQQFFLSPVAEKAVVSIASNKAGKNHGWLSQGVERLDPATQKRPDVKEAFNIGECIDDKLQQPMPEALQAHVKKIIDFQRHCHQLCMKILRLFALGLDIDPDWFVARHDSSKGPSGTVFRLLYYPWSESYEEGVDIRAGAHSDFGSITLLFQQAGQPGLEINTSDGEWAAVPVDPGIHSTSYTNGQDGRRLPILVNIGDLLDDWTCGLLKSTVHRVVFPKQGHADRYSMAYFCHPVDDAVLEPVPSKVVIEHASRALRENGRSGKAITARDHLMERLAATYKIE